MPAFPGPVVLVGDNFFMLQWRGYVLVAGTDRGQTLACLLLSMMSERSATNPPETFASKIAGVSSMVETSYELMPSSCALGKLS